MVIVESGFKNKIILCIVLQLCRYSHFSLFVLHTLSASNVLYVSFHLSLLYRKSKIVSLIVSLFATPMTSDNDQTSRHMLFPVLVYSDSCSCRSLQYLL